LTIGKDFSSSFEKYAKKGNSMIAIHTPGMKLKNTMRIMMVYGTSGLIASLIYWSIGYLLFTGTAF
jgi:hypothetical protein